MRWACHGAKQAFAMIAGGIMGAMCLIGLLILIHRRSTERALPRRCFGDKLVLVWLLITVSLGPATIPVSAGTWTAT